MFSHILCPTDLSDASDHAAAQASAIAGWYGARVTALHVISTPGHAVSPEVGDAHTAELRTTIERRFAAPDRRSAVDVLLEHGVPAARILDRAAALPADLIVMGTHGTGGFTHLVLGSVTEKVLRQARCPVLTVPPRVHSTARVPFARILCAVDFSQASLTAVKLAASLAQESNAHLTLLHVIEWPWQEPPAPKFEDMPMAQSKALEEFRRYRERGAQTALEELAQACPGAAGTSTQVLHGRSHVRILDTAQTEGSDLIVVGVASRGTLDLAFLGSTASHVIRSAACPVLTFKS